MCIVVLIFSSSISQSSCLKADSSFIWKTTTHNRFVVLFTSEFYRVLKRNSSELIAMKHKLNYTVEAGSKLTTLFIFFILRIRERKLVRWLLEVEIFTSCSGGSRPSDKGGWGVGVGCRSSRPLDKGGGAGRAPPLDPPLPFI